MVRQETVINTHDGIWLRVGTVLLPETVFTLTATLMWSKLEVVGHRTRLVVRWSMERFMVGVLVI